MLALHPKDNPQASPKDLDKRHDKRNNIRVLDVGVENDKQYPRHAEDGIDDDGAFVPPHGLEREDLTEVVRGLFLA